MRRKYYRNRFSPDAQAESRRKRILFGFTLAIIGVLLMLRTMGLLYIDFRFAWPFIPIAIGLFIGIKSRFRNASWWILIVIGLANLIPQFYIMNRPSSHFVWPAILIGLGLSMALRPRHKYPCGRGMDNTSVFTSTENTINIDVTFGGRKELITARDFKGGFIATTFGGTEVNLMQADTPDKIMILELRVSFGGVELVVPSHWEIQNEMSLAFSSVEDERVVSTSPADTDNRKVLILRGSCSFGGIEIKSF